ncbi:MAG: hypothetical protein NTW91_03715 [Verrucomicrobia bacterium]|nr:hypothetical protein [Verrucomicrobiota bacterium]
MKRLLQLLPLLSLTLLTICLGACTSHLQQKENFLREAGFRAVTPSTPAQVAKVQALRQGHITQVTRSGKTLFVLADAKQNLLFIGGNPQFERYQQILYTKKVDPAIANEKADKMLENDWGGWGGMMDPFFGGPMMMY